MPLGQAWVAIGIIGIGAHLLSRSSFGEAFLANKSNITMSRYKEQQSSYVTAVTSSLPPAADAAAAEVLRVCGAGRCPDWSVSPAWR